MLASLIFLQTAETATSRSRKALFHIPKNQGRRLAKPRSSQAKACRANLARTGGQETAEATMQIARAFRAFE
jgi:hypothetical protein